MQVPGSAARYRSLLEPWIRAARPWLYRLPEAPECICYGVGYHNHWAIQANATAFTAFACLAADPNTDSARTGMGRDELLDTALGMLRFTVRGHLAGAGACADGQRWGHSWISALCQERMQHGIEAIAQALDPRDLDGLRAMTLSEADWLLDNHPIAAALTGPENRPESNLWNGALLCRAATLYPDAPRAADYVERAHGFLLNAISVPADALSETVLAGRPLKEWHRGANFFDSYACNHHGYLNVGYIGITLSNIAMLHFFFRGLGQPAPESLYHHVDEVWPLFKACTFPDGRLLRIGGDTRVRYCYCQDYAIPIWLMLRDRLGDTDTEAFESGWLAQVAREQAENPDGAFLGRRLAAMARISPLYYTRLEGDRAVTLAMGACWRRRFAEFADRPIEAPVRPVSQWHDAYHGACLVRGPQRLVSWVWGAAEPPQGLCLPPDGSDLAEWRQNLAGRVAGLGMINGATVLRHAETPFSGGFVTSGRLRWKSEKLYAEGEPDVETAVEDLAVAALPDGVTLLGLQRCGTLQRVLLAEVKGLLLSIPNDVQNGFQRTYASGAATVRFRGGDGKPAAWTAPESWLSVDQRLGVVSLYGGPLTVLHPADARITIKAYPWQAHTHVAGGFLFVDQVCLVCRDAPGSYDRGKVLFDLGFAVLAGAGPDQMAHFAAADRHSHLSLDHPNLRAVRVTGVDGVRYLFVANFGDEPATIPIPPGRAVAVGLPPGAALAPDADRCQLLLSAGQAALLAQD
jgi:hypothetical protein